MRFFGLPELKIFLRSGSLRFAMDRKGTGERGSVSIYGKPFFYRPGTSDTWIILEVLINKGCKSEYWLPDTKDSPSTILDIGGNIGCTAVYFANRYPEAVVYSFEPDLENFKLLSLNTAGYENIKIYNVALGDRDSVMTLGCTEDHVNFGAKTLVLDRQRSDLTNEVPVREAQSFICELGIRSVNLVKIDTEGFEYPILRSLAPVLEGCEWIFGELHDHRDFSALALFERSHSIGIVKGVGQVFSPFFACHRGVLSRLSDSDRKKILGRFKTR